MRRDGLLKLRHYSREERRPNSTLLRNRESSSNYKVQYSVARVEMAEMNSLTLCALQKHVTSVSSAGYSFLLECV